LVRFGLYEKGAHINSLLLEDTVDFLRLDRSDVIVLTEQVALSLSEEGLEFADTHEAHLSSLPPDTLQPDVSGLLA